MKFVAEDDKLTIKFEGMEVFFGLKKEIILPKNQITGLTWSKEYNFKDLLLRVGGTGAPRLLFAGRFRDMDNKKRLFLYLHLPKGLPLTRSLSDANVLAISVRDFNFDEVFVNCKPEIGSQLVDWFKG